MGRIVERKTTRLVVGEYRRGLTEGFLNGCARLAYEAMLPNDLVASMVEANYLRAMKPNIANDVSNGGDHDHHQDKCYGYD